MKVKDLHWKCPSCGSRVDFGEDLEDLFNEDGDAWFDPEHGVYFMTTVCDECEVEWIFNISKMENNAMKN